MLVDTILQLRYHGVRNDRRSCTDHGAEASEPSFFCEVAKRAGVEDEDFDPFGNGH